MGDEKLRTIGARSGVSHGQYAWGIMLEFCNNFIVKLVAWTTSTRAFGTATLNHEVCNHPVKFQSIVIWLTFRF